MDAASMWTPDVNLDVGALANETALRSLEALARRQVLHELLGDATPLPESFYAVGGVDLPPVRGIERTTQGFREKTEAVARRLGIPAIWLFLIMAFETARTFNPAERNPVSGATGLIQFMPETARALQSSTEALARMSGVDQLDFVERYFNRYRGRLHSLQDAYMAVLAPFAVGRPQETPLYKLPSVAYRQNRGLDANNDGVITAGEATRRVEQMQSRAEGPSSSSATVLLVGDSLAVGLARPLRTLAEQAGIVFVGRGIGGTAAPQWARRSALAEALAITKPSVVLVSLGTNDAASYITPHDESVAVNDIIDRIRESGARPVWLLPPPMPFRDRNGSLITTRAVLADRRVRTLDASRRRIERTSDRIHPTSRGYEEWARWIAKTLPLTKQTTRAAKKKLARTARKILPLDGAGIAPDVTIGDRGAGWLPFASVVLGGLAMTRGL